MYHHTIQIFYEELLDGVGSISNLWEGHKASDQLLSRVRLCNSMNRSTPGLPVPVPHQGLDLANNTSKLLIARSGSETITTSKSY